MATPTKQDLIDSLQSEWTNTAALFNGLSERAWDVPVYTEPMLWTPRHLVVHLNDAETIFRLLLLNVLKGGEGSPEGENVDEHNADAVPKLMAAWANESNAALVDRLAAVRERLIAVVETLPEDLLLKQMRHPLLGMMSVHEFIRVVYLHVKVHGRDIKRAVQAANLTSA